MTQSPSFKKSFLLILSWLKSGMKQAHAFLLPKSLLYRFILIILLPLILLQTVVAIFFYDRHWGTVSRRLSADVAGEILTIADFIDRAYPNMNAIEQVQKDFERHLLFEISFYPEKEMLFAPTFVSEEALELQNALSLMPYPSHIKESLSNKKIILLQLRSGLLEVSVPRKRIFSSTVYVFLIWMIGSSVLLFWIAFLFMKNQVRSIERLSKASELFGMGHDLSHFKPEGAREVKQAGFSFILMKERIQKYLSERTLMLAGVSHDLRTPLTRMKLQLSMMEQNETTADLQSDILEMEHMLNGYLNFTRGTGHEKMTVLSLNALVLNEIEKLRKIGQKIDFHDEQRLYVSVREHDLSRAIANILTNAGRYATQARVTLGVRQNMACVIIDDDGPGIPAEKRGEVFKAFYRMEASRNSATGGVGLGLTITRDILLSHGGDVVLSESPWKGLRVVLSLPLRTIKNSSKSR